MRHVQTPTIVGPGVKEGGMVGLVDNGSLEGAIGLLSAHLLSLIMLHTHLNIQS